MTGGDVHSRYVPSASLDSLGLPETAFLLLRDLIHEKTGIFFDEVKREILGDKLAALVVNRGFDSFLDYYYLLKYDAAADDEWLRVVDALSVQETYFWRESEQIKTLADVVVARHFARPNAAPLKIWSAACATGEEPLSIAMALEEAGWFARAPIEILASDASPSALEKARNGLYRERSFRSIPGAFFKKYFEPAQNLWRVAPSLHARVQWRQANVANENEIWGLAASHVIFCRNMFIYFSEASVRKTVRFFAQRMPAPGYLFVGASESLLRVSTDYRLEELNGAFVYTK